MKHMFEHDKMKHKSIRSIRRKIYNFEIGKEEKPLKIENNCQTDTRTANIKRKRISTTRLMIAICIVAGIFFFVFSGMRHSGNWVVVEVEGREYCRLSILEDGEQEIVTQWGNNWLVIQKGKVYIKEADCKNQVCVHTKPIDQTGESIVCLPHKVNIYITGNNESETDAVTN